MTCKDVMTANPRCCLAEDSVVQAAGIMRDKNVGAVPVVSDRQTWRVVGIVTDRDIAVKVVSAGRDPRSTRVDEVMSKDLISCGLDDDYEEAVRAMRRHQVRRIVVVDRDRSLAGIISQADVAREGSDREVGDLVQEVSEPASMGHSLKSVRRPVEEPDVTPMLMGLACFGIGAGMMYLMDPDRGRGRRAVVRDRAKSIYNDSRDYAGKVQRDVSNRASGLAAMAKSRFKHDDADDRTIEDRVRSKLGHVASHPHSIHVTIEQGSARLEGSAMADEADRIISEVRSVPGVKEVVNMMDVHEAAARR